MLSVVIPVLNSGDDLTALLAATMPYVDETIVVDGGSTDGSRGLAEAAGARVLATPRGRGLQLAAGAAAAKGDWLLFLHADTVLSPGWRAATEEFQTRPGAEMRAGFFELAFDEASRPARRTAAIANWRARRIGLPYGDQGLLISKAFYMALGGYRPLPLMEDVDLVRRIGRGRLSALAATATTSAVRYRDAGWTRRSAKNLTCLALYYLGVDPAWIIRIYG